MLQDKVFAVWAFSSSAPVQTKFHLDDGRRALVRAPVNQERSMNMQTLNEYTAKAKSTGLLLGLGSELWAIPVDALVQIGRCQFLLLTGGTRVEAIYRAHEEDPRNPQVVATIEGQSPKIVLFRTDTPRDVQEYLRDIGNSLNDLAVSVTWLESLAMVPTFNSIFEAEKAARDTQGEPSWSMSALTQAAKEAKDKGIKGVLGYEATFYNFVNQLYPDRFSGVVEFQCARAGYKRLTDAGAFDDFRAWAQAAVVWTDKRMNSGIIFTTLGESFKRFDKHAPDLSSQYAPLVVRFAAVTNGAGAPFIIREKSDIAMLDKLFLVLGGDDKKIMKQPGYQPTYTPPAGSRRPTLFLDELGRVVSNCLAGVPDDDVKWAVHDQLVTIAMSYLLTGSVCVVLDDKGQLQRIVVPDKYVSGASKVAKAVVSTPKPKGKSKAKAKAKRSSGFKKDAADPAPDSPAGDEEAIDHAAAAELHDDDDVDASDAADADDIGLTKITLSTHLSMLKFVGQHICKSHRLKRKDIFFDDVEEEEEKDNKDETPSDNGATAAAANIATQPIDSISKLVGVIKSSDDNKHTKASVAFSAFMRSHPDVKPELIALAHPTMASALSSICQKSGEETAALISHARRIVSASGPAASARMSGTGIPSPHAQTLQANSVLMHRQVHVCGIADIIAYAVMLMSACVISVLCSYVYGVCRHWHTPHACHVVCCNHKGCHQ